MDTMTIIDSVNKEGPGVVGGGNIWEYMGNRSYLGQGRFTRP